VRCLRSAKEIAGGCLDQAFPSSPEIAEVVCFGHSESCAIHVQKEMTADVTEKTFRVLARFRNFGLHAHPECLGWSSESFKSSPGAHLRDCPGARRAIEGFSVGLVCSLRGHSWKGCRCVRCGATGHQWRPDRDKGICEHCTGSGYDRSEEIPAASSHVPCPACGDTRTKNGAEKCNLCGQTRYRSPD
jgi:hypothetical protein